MKEKKIVYILLMVGFFSLTQGIPVATRGEDQKEIALPRQQVLKWRKERDAFFKSHQRSPLLLSPRITRIYISSLPVSQSL